MNKTQKSRNMHAKNRTPGRSMCRLLWIFAGLMVLASSILLPKRWHPVYGLSMAPTLYEGDAVSYSCFQTPNYGSLVVFEAPDPAYGLIVKRVIGLPGDRISMNADGTVIRNDRELIEPYIKKDVLGNSSMGKITVDTGKLFVLGDNRGASIDSRDPHIGQIAAEQICGCVVQAKRHFQ